MLEDLTNNIVLRMEAIADMVGSWLDAHFFNILTVLLLAWLIKRAATFVAGRVVRAAVRPESHPTKADREKRIKTLYSLALGVVRMLAWGVAGILIISEIWPGSLALLITGAGVIGLVIGFGAQNLIRDITSGIFVIIENQYRIGDQVSITGTGGVGQVEGVVEDLNIRTTVLRDLSGTAHYLPNGSIGLTSNKTLGFSRMSEEMTVALDTNMEELEKVIKKVGDELAAMPELSDRIVHPPRLASITGFKDGGVAVRISAKTKPAEQWKIRSEFYKRLRRAFVKHKIKLADE